jgi:hypothetical protein
MKRRAWRKVFFGTGMLLSLLALVMVGWAQEQSSKGPVFITIDHASVCGSNLDTLRQAFTNIGLASEYGGPHANGITHMALLGFDNGSYLELIAPQTAGKTEGSGWSNFMAGDAGPCAWAISSQDIEQDVVRLKAAGVPVSGPEAGSRKRPDGMSVEWQTASLGSGPPGSTLPFLIQDRTPRAWRVQPTQSLQGSGLTGFAAIVVGVRDLNAASALFEKAFNWDPPVMEEHRDFDAKLAYFPGTPVILATPLNGRGWLADRLQKFGDSPAAFLLSAPDFNAASKKFHLSGSKTWFQQRVAWFDEHKLNGWRIGVLGQ